MLKWSFDIEKYAGGESALLLTQSASNVSLLLPEGLLDLQYYALVDGVPYIPQPAEYPEGFGALISRSSWLVIRAALPDRLQCTVAVNGRTGTVTAGWSSIDSGERRAPMDWAVVKFSRCIYSLSNETCSFLEERRVPASGPWLTEYGNLYAATDADEELVVVEVYALSGVGASEACVVSANLTVYIATQENRGRSTMALLISLPIVLFSVLSLFAVFLVRIVLRRSRWLSFKPLDEVDTEPAVEMT